MNRRPITVLTLLVLGLAPLGCIDDPAIINDSIPISEEEARLLALDIFSDAFEAREATDVAVSAAVAAAPASSRGTGTLAAAVPISAAADTTIACELSGSIYVAVAVTGEVDETTGEAVLDFSLLQVHRDCGQSNGDVTFRLEGDPSVTTLLRIVSDGQQNIDLLGSMSGAVGVTSDGREGRCEIALAFTGRQNADGTATVTLTGMVCGMSVDHTASTTG